MHWKRKDVASYRCAGDEQTVFGGGGGAVNLLMGEQACRVGISSGVASAPAGKQQIEAVSAIYHQAQVVQAQQ